MSMELTTQTQEQVLPQPQPQPRPLHSLYVGDLDPSVTEKHLAQMFLKFGDLDSVVLCLDTVTQQSLCYGFLNYRTLEAAKKAMETLNYSVVNGKSIRIMWQQPDSEVINSGKGNLFVKNLDASIDNKKLNKIFSDFGNILSCKVAVQDDGRSKGFAFVQYADEKSANAAIDNLNGSFIQGKPLYVAHFIKKCDRIQASFTNVFIKNLEVDVTEELLEEMFSKIGSITSLVISKDVNGVSKGFGFVNFKNHGDAKQAVQTMHGTQLGSKILYVDRAQKRDERSQILKTRQERVQRIKGRNLYIKNISDDVTEDNLKAYFGPFGCISSVKIMRTLNGTSKGFGFVLFSQCEEAKRAIIALNGYMYHGKPLYVALTQSKSERKEFLRNLYTNLGTGLPGVSNTLANNFYHPPPPPRRLDCPQQDYSMTFGWRSSFQPPPMHRGRMMNGHMYNYSMPFKSNGTPPEQNNHFMHTYKYPTHQRPATRFNRIFANGNGQPQNLSSMLAAATPVERKLMLRQRLYPLVEKLDINLCSHIVDLLLQMDNSELLVLLESPESLAAKVEEAILVLDAAATNEDTSKT